MEENELKKVRESEFNGFHSPEIVRVSAKIRSSGYTSLKDLLQSASPSESSPAAMMMTSASPTASSSWNEIPIRNPLVKHAAMAYLQPLSAQTTPFGSEKGLFARLRDKCCGGGGDFGCASWLCDAVSSALRGLFGYGRRRGRRRDDDDDDDDDDDENDIDGEKFD